MNVWSYIEICIFHLHFGSSFSLDLSLFIGVLLHASLVGLCCVADIDRFCNCVSFLIGEIDLITDKRLSGQAPARRRDYARPAGYERVNRIHERRHEGDGYAQLLS